MTKFKTKRRHLIGAVSLIALSTAVGTAHAESQAFDIEAQSLDKALLIFNEQSGVTVAAPRDLVQGKLAPAVQGEMEPEQALEMIISSSGLALNRLEVGAYTIQVAALEEEDEPPAPFRTAQLVQENDVQPVSDAEAASSRELTMETTVVTGVRGAPRSVTDSPIPIDVFSSEQLEQIPTTGGLFEQFRYLVPAINLPQRAGGGTATFIASAGLRGLNPDQTLVLVNGKRRHKTSLINTSTGLYSGSAGVDLNMIPSSAIGRVEVLRDGAAAQYGSDAIAGVVNIILKDDAEGGSVTATRGANFDRGDGEFFSAGGNAGFALGEDGFLNVSFDYRTNEQSERANPVPVPTEPGASFRFFPDVDNGDGTFSVDPREGLVNRLVRNFGVYPATRISGAFNAKYDLGNDLELYSFGTYTDRESTLFFTYRRPRDGRNNPEVFPNGFIPEEEIREEDYELVGGLRGTVNGFDWDLSGGYGKNEADWYNPVGANASLGEFSPTSFYLGAFEVEELSANLDVTKAFDLADRGDLQVSFGLQARQEEFSISEGDPEGSLTFDSPFVVQPADPRGAQGFPAFGPDDVSSVSRDNVGVYGELGWQATPKFYINGAARYESYSDDSGDTTTFKVASRYDPVPWLGIRGSVNTGFRAPSVQQLGFKGSRGQFVDLDNDSIAETIVLRQTLPATDLAAAALGADPLQPEESTNFSAGFTLTPANGLVVTLDAYQIDIEDRIVLSAQFNRGDARAALGGGTIGDQVSVLLDSAGIGPSIDGANYFTNALDTQSRGVDLVATYSLDVGSGDLAFSGAFNYNNLEIEGVDANPEELSGLVLANGEPLQQFDRARLGTYTDEIPETKLVLSTNYQSGPFGLLLRGTRFGEYTNVTNNPAADTDNSAEFIVDLQVTYDFDGGFSVSAGSNNVFNTYPEEVRAEGVFGGGQYDTMSPFGFTGGTWFVSGRYEW